MARTPTFGIRTPDTQTKARDLGSALETMALDFESALVQAQIPPVQAAPVMTAPTELARDQYWGKPTTTAAQKLLQDRGATTMRTDTGELERYFAAYNVTTNPGGAVHGAGWYTVGGVAIGTNRSRLESTMQVIAAGGSVPLQFTTLDGLARGIEYAAATGAFTVKRAGIWEIAAQGVIEGIPNDGSRRILQITSPQIAVAPTTNVWPAVGARTYMSLATRAALPLNSTVQINVRQDSSTTGSGFGAVGFSYVGPA